MPDSAPHGDLDHLKADPTAATAFSGINIFDLEGTYLAWVDFRPLGFTPEQIVQKIEGWAGLALDHGDWFGENGAGFERFNIACPRSILEKAVAAAGSAFS